MSNIIDKIRVSGTDYTLSATTSGVSVVEVTQAEYDALPSSAKTDTSKMYVITDAEAGDLSQYWTSAQTSSAITQAVSGKVDTTTFNTYSGNVETALSEKQDTLVSGTNIKTINNESILGNGNIDIQGGGGKAVSGGTNISITTGETADTINCTLPITNRNNALSFFSNSTVIQNSQSVNFGYSNSFGSSPTRIFNFGDNNSTPMYGNYYYVNFGNYNSLEGYGWDYTFGRYLKVTNQNETAFGKYNKSNTNTLFSVGNGTGDSASARHNALEIRQNGDIYCSDGTNDVKLQDTIKATAANTTALGGLSLVKLTQAQYDALATKDSNVLYVIVG